MKKRVTQKLAAYSALAAGALVATTGANAQIIYHDVDPDATFTNDGDSLDIDLNNDGVNDFMIWLLNDPANAYSVRLYPEMGNEALGSASAGSGFFYPFALNANDMISSGQSMWNGTINAGALTMAWKYVAGGSYGNWFGATDKFLGVRFLAGTNLHYGWIRLDVSANGDSFTVKDWAFNAQSDGPIMASQTTGIQDQLSVEASVYAHNATLFLTLSQDVKGTVSVVNMLGQTVRDIEITGAKMEIDLSDCDGGIYMVTINSANGNYTKKIAI